MAKRRIDAEWLQEWATADPRQVSPTGAYRIVYHWGSAAPWCLRPELLEKAATEARRRGQEGFAQRLSARPALPESPGSCCVLFALRNPTAYAALRECFLLPLQWSQETDGLDRLPDSLRSVAQRVRRLLEEGQGGRKEKADLSSWNLRLHPAPGFDSFDLSGFDALRCDSAAVPLAAGLLLAAEGGVPATDVSATGALDSRGRVMPVDLLEAKVAAAVEHGARWLFVPASQAEKAREIVLKANAEIPGIVELSESASTLGAALSDYVAELDLPPRGGPFQNTRDWYLRQCRFRRGGAQNKFLQEYYRHELLDGIIRRARRRLPVEVHDQPAATHLVTIASDRGRDLVTLSAGVLQPTHVLVFHTRDSREIAEAARDDIGRRCEDGRSGCVVELAEVRRDDGVSGGQPADLAWGAQFRRAIDQHWTGVDPRRVVLDVTPGMKDMSLALVLKVAHPGNRLLYIRQNWRGSERIPGEEQPILLPAPPASS